MGGQVIQQIIFFETETDFDRFTLGGFELAADAAVTALTASASTQATTMGNQGVQLGLIADETNVKGFDAGLATPVYANGKKVFSLVIGGFMYQATIGGQKFKIALDS